MKKSLKTMVFLVFTVSAIVFALWMAVFLIEHKIVQEEVFYSSVNLTYHTIGFDVNKEALTFGNVVIGGSAARSILFENRFPFSVSVTISADGSIVQVIRFAERETVKANETKKITFVADAFGAEKGFYEGNVTFKVTPYLR